ncbi:MAG TPA: PspC domain-containing protein [Acidimicrobiales bacterium]|nr:PspC domain-containing protein [Acidimicrobiales bacterium]
MDDTPITEPTAPESEPAPPAGPAAATPPRAPRLRRSSTHRVLGGVAGGLGERFDVDANVFRVAFVVLAILWGVGIAIYLAMWIILPGDGLAVDGASESPPRTRGGGVRSALLAVGGAVVAVILAILFVVGLTHGRGPHAFRAIVVFWLLLLIVLAFVVTRAAGSGRSILRVIGALVATLLVLAVITSGAFVAYLASTGVPFSGGIGSRSWAPVSFSDVQHQYRNGIGSELVDLSSVTFPKTGYVVHASVGVGVLTVDVPAHAVVDVRTTIGAGNVEYGVPAPWGFEYRPFTEVPTGLTGAAVAKAPHLTLDCAVGVGKIRIQRG